MQVESANDDVVYLYDFLDGNGYVSSAASLHSAHSLSPTLSDDTGSIQPQRGLVDAETCLLSAVTES